MQVKNWYVVIEKFAAADFIRKIVQGCFSAGSYSVKRGSNNTKMIAITKAISTGNQTNLWLWNAKCYPTDKGLECQMLPNRQRIKFINIRSTTTLCPRIWLWNFKSQYLFSKHCFKLLQDSRHFKTDKVCLVLLIPLHSEWKQLALIWPRY